jgi:uncharacterized phage protein (predicted DNA packaging)
MTNAVISLDEAREWLRLDNTDNDAVIAGLIEGAAQYITIATGLTVEDQAASPLAQTATKFLLSLWYDPTQADTDKLQRSIDNLLKAVAHVG